MMDIFGRPISGAAYAGDVGGTYKVLDRPQNVGHFFLAMRPDIFIPLDEYRKRMNILVERVPLTPPVEGFTEIRIPRIIAA
jgi:LDH2 family malate/lactate/ureidoglycolate dehydrogenase